MSTVLTYIILTGGVAAAVTIIIGLAIWVSTLTERE